MKMKLRPMFAKKVTRVAMAGAITQFWTCRYFISTVLIICEHIKGCPGVVHFEVKSAHLH